MILGKHLGSKSYYIINIFPREVLRKEFVCFIPNEIQNRNSYSTLTKRVNANNLKTNSFLQKRYESEDLTQHKTTGLFNILSESAPVEFSQNFISGVHDYTGLPWWASIIFTTVALRTCITLPLAVYQSVIMAKFENLLQEMPKLVEELKLETAMAIKKFNWTEQHARAVYNRSLKKQFSKLIIRDNCHPLKTTIVLWIQLPMWVFISMGLRNLSYMLPKMDINAQIIFMELSTGGCAWIPNLTEVDHSFILPVLLGLTNLAITELQVLTRTKKGSQFQKYITYFFRSLSICMIPIAANVPASMCLYWTTSSVFGLIQNLVLMSPRIKRTLRIPLTITEKKNPYKTLKEDIILKFGGTLFKLYKTNK